MRNLFIFTVLAAALLFSGCDRNDDPYTETITLESAGLSSYSYHIKNPSPGDPYKHLCFAKDDYDWLVEYLYDSPAEFLSEFGFAASEDKTYSYETYYMLPFDVEVDIYSGTEYTIAVGTVDASGNVIGNVTTYEFSTEKAEESPYGFDIKVSDISSTKAKVTVTPEEGIVKYRVDVSMKSDYEEEEARGGEAAVRNMIIGNWSSTNDEYTAAASFVSEILLPDSEFRVGVVGFDAQNREKVVFYDFTTAEAIGPDPEFTVTQNETSTPWNSASFTLKGKYIMDGCTMILEKEKVEAYLEGGWPMDELIAFMSDNRLEEDDVERILGDGYVYTAESLEPETEYVFGVYLYNDEYVVVYKTFEFTTSSRP